MAGRPPWHRIGLKVLFARLQVLTQTPKAIFPEIAVLRSPVIHRTQRSRVNAIEPLAAYRPAHDQPSFAQNTQMLRDGGKSDIELPRQFRHWLFSRAEQIQKPTPVSVRNSVEYFGRGLRSVHYCRD